MLSFTNKLLQHILETVEVLPDCLFRERGLKQISTDAFNLLCKEKLLEFHQYNPDGSNIPCPDQAICGETCDRIVRKIKGRFEAVCPDSSSSPIALSQEDINKYSFDIKAFIEVIRNDNNLAGNYEGLDDRLYFIGTKEINRRIVGLVIALFNNKKTAGSLLLNIPQILPDYHAIIVLSPYFNGILQPILKTLSNKRVYFNNFNTVFSDKGLTLNSNLFSIIPSKKEKQVLATSRIAKGEQPTKEINQIRIRSKGKTWSDIELSFTKQNRVLIYINGKNTFSRSITHERLNLHDGSSPDKPIEEWNILRELAENPTGVFSLARLKSNRPLLEKYVSNLRGILKNIFQIKDNPIPKKKRTQPYQFAFKLSSQKEAVKDLDSTGYISTSE